MTARAALVLLSIPSPRLPVQRPDDVAGIDPVELCLAMCEDVYEVLAGLDLVEAGIAGAPEDVAAVRSVVWPGAPVVPVAAITGSAAQQQSILCAALRRLPADSYGQVVLVAADAPDLPGLLIGKLFRGLARADVAVCPAQGGGLVSLATRLPAPAWLLDCDVDLDTRDAVETLRAAAPRRTAVSIGPGWHRVRAWGDLAQLDQGLEGWEATRRLISRG